RRGGEPAEPAGAQAGGDVRTAVRRAVHRRDRHHGGQVRDRADGHRPGVARHGAAALDRVPVRAARLVPDVLPLPPGGVGLLAHRRIATPRSRPCRGRDREPGRGQGDGAMTTAFIFGLLIVLMLTGMPISIALGLTVLTFLYTMTEVPIEAVALKLFTGIENFEIMAIPVFILAGN